MIKFKTIFYIFIVAISVLSCAKDDPPPAVEPPRDFEAQYNVDIALIEDYLKNNYITVVNSPGDINDQDVTIAKIDNGQQSIMSYLDSKTYPKLLIRPVTQDKIIYKLYYLVLREGVGEYPCNTDGILTSYRGTYLSRTAATATTPSELKATFFEEVKYPQSFLDLSGLDLISKGGDYIKGWKEVFPKFKEGTAKINTNGTVANFDFGSGVAFLPSGLAYFNAAQAFIPAYSPLVFSFKLLKVQRLDHDNDGVFDFYEDLNNDRYLPYFKELVASTEVADDTDKDRNPDYLDVDDDNDNFTTRLEITKPAGTNSGLSKLFPFNPITDNIFTTIDETETKGIPSYNPINKTFDYTSPDRKRVHVDASYPIK